MKKSGFLILPLILAIAIIIWSSHSVYKEIYPSSTEKKELGQDTQKTDNPDQTTGGITTGQVTGGSGGGGSKGGGGGSSGASSPQEPPAEQRTYCTSESRDVETCEPNDHPVCGWFDRTQVNCESGPCVRSTFPNECEACLNPTILYWTEGECPIHE